MFRVLSNQHYQHRTNQKLRSWANAVFQNRGVCGQAFPSFPSPSPVIPFCFALVPTFLDELARKRLLRKPRYVAVPDRGPGTGTNYEKRVNGTRNSARKFQPGKRAYLFRFYNHLEYGLRVLVRGYHLGSLTITVECSSLQTLEGLWNDYTSGHLEEVAQEALVTSDVLKTLGIAGMKLKTFISEEEYEKGKKELVENLGQPDIGNT